MLDPVTADETAAPRLVGRPRDDELTSRILDAAKREIAENGVEQFSVRGVARTAGVSRPTVARRWPDSNDLLRDALGLTRPVALSLSGDPRRDLIALGRMMLAGLSSETLDVQLRVAADAGLHPAAHREMQLHAIRPTLDALQDVLAQVQPVRPADDIEWAAHAFVGALFFRTVANPDRKAPTQDEMTDLVDHLLGWLIP